MSSFGSNVEGEDTIFDDGNICVKKVEGKGYGVVAQRAFEKGDIVLQEMPFARVSKNTQEIASKNSCAAALMKRVFDLSDTGTFDPTDKDSWPEEVVACLDEVLDIQSQQVFDLLTPDAAAKWMALQYTPLPHESNKAVSSTPTPGRILRTNAYDDVSGVANLYALSCRINHSCIPNATRIAGGRGQGEVMIVALRPIAVAQEIFVSYLDTADQGGDGGMRTDERRGYLRKNYGFNCTCHLCSRCAHAGCNRVDSSSSNKGSTSALSSSTNPLLQCGRCRRVWYCSKDCQVRDWKDGHKLRCYKEP